MTKQQIRILERCFAAEITGRQICQMQPSKALSEMIDQELVIEIELRDRNFTARGFCLTSLGHMTYCNWCAAQPDAESDL